MRMHRSLSAIVAALFLTVLFAVVFAKPAQADAKKDVQTKVREAMENFDLLEYEEAKKLLGNALAIAKKNNLDKEAVTAQAHLRLGIVYFLGFKDTENAKTSFMSAVETDAKIQIDPSYKTPEMQKLLDQARTEVAARAANAPAKAPPATATADCKALSGMQHTLVDSGAAAAPLGISADVGSDVNAAKVVVRFRSGGAPDFTEGVMEKSGSCSYAGQIPADAMAGDLVYYYVAAYNAAGKLVASKGSSGSPNIIEVTAAKPGAAPTAGDTENPLSDGEDPTASVSDDSGATSSGGSASGGVLVGGKRPKVFVAVAAGTGGGIITGKTEQDRNDVSCCFAPALFHVFPEVGYRLSGKTAVSLAVRVGFPIGANITGHATAAPSAYVRVHRAFDPSGNGLRVTGSVGGGVLRNTVKLSEAPAGMDTDIAAMGPLLVGAGGGYTKPLGSTLKLNAEANVLAGIPVVKEMGNSILNFGVQFDLNVGVLFDF